MIDEGLAGGFNKRPRRASGVESVKTELDALNRQYIDQVLWANTRLKDISAIFSDANIDIQVPKTVIYSWSAVAQLVECKIGDRRVV